MSAPQRQTLSVYFIGFAVGVLLWGGFSDRYGRRPGAANRAGRLCDGMPDGAVGCGFSLLLAARIVTAIGAATGSVVTQTVLRTAITGGSWRGFSDLSA